MSNHAMVSASQFDPAQLTFRDLICHYGTGRVIHIDGRGASKQVQYRFGIQTEIGDFEVHEWMKLVRVLIERAGRRTASAAPCRTGRTRNALAAQGF